MKKTMKRIERFAKKERVEFIKSKNNNYIFKSGSTFVYVIINKDEGGEWVYFVSLVVKDAKIDMELIKNTFYSWVHWNPVKTYRRLSKHFTRLVLNEININ